MTVEDLLEAHLRKAFHVYLTEIRNILNVLASEVTSSLLYSLVNQTDQLLCCQRLKLEDTPLSAFTDLPARLNYNISTQIEAMVDKLRTAIRQIEASQGKMLTQQKMVTEQYESSWQQQPLSVESTAQGTATRPSVSQLLEWLGDLEQDAFYILVEKRHLVNQLDLRSEETVKRLQNTWSADHGLQDKVTHVEAYLQFFMEEQS